jgi:hypothetical protein
MRGPAPGQDRLLSGVHRGGQGAPHESCLQTSPRSGAGGDLGLSTGSGGATSTGTGSGLDCSGLRTVVIRDFTTSHSDFEVTGSHHRFDTTIGCFVDIPPPK